MLSASGARPVSRASRSLAALACLGLVAASVLFFVRQRSERTRPDAFVKRFALDLRRAGEIGPMKFESEPDLAAAIAIRAALSDTDASLPSVPLRARDDEIAAARDLALDAVATRPGWAYHRFLVGRLAYSAGGSPRASSAAAIRNDWATPIQLAALGAPGMDEIWSALAQLYLENWQRLSSPQRSEAIPVLRRALQDPLFVAVRFSTLSAAVGRDEAIGLLPENPDLLRAAADSSSLQGDLGAVSALLDRLDTAQRKARATDLARIEGRFRARDQNGLRAACADWAENHPGSELDDPAGRAEAARVLELWPGDRGGPWEGDPRADLVRFFLDGRESAVSAETLLRTLGALSGVPDHVVARVKLRAGDVEGAEDLAARPQNLGAPEWTLYYADLARLLLKQGRSREARGALDRLALAGRDDCDALLARRDVARALGDPVELSIVGQRLAALRSSPRRQDSSLGGVTFLICVDPELAGASNLDLKLASKGPAIARYGWGIGRAGTALIGDERVISVPLAGLSGWCDLTVQSVAGSPVRASASLNASH